MFIERIIGKAPLLGCAALILSSIPPLCALPSAAAEISASADTTNLTTGPTLGEIVVTAEKHEERLQDVPIPVTAISGESLASNNQTRLEDFYQQIPGLTIAPGSFTGSVVAIRGITTGAGTNASTVGVMIDGMPFGSSLHLIVPDFDPGDLARVEVLRGPQGTLYGTSSMGGLLNFVTNDPSTDAIKGRVEAGTNTVHNGSGLGYTFRGSVNVPVTGDLALRLSAFTRLDPGYIDNPVTHVDGINQDRADGVHFAALWKPSDALSVKLSALYQVIKGDGTSDVNVVTPGYVGPPLGDLQQNYIPSVGPYEKEASAYSLVVNDKIGRVALTSITEYNVFAFRDSSDATYGLGGFTEFGVPGTGFTGFGVAGTPLLSNSRTEKYTEEFRISAPIVQGLEGLLGLFYTNEFQSAAQILQAENATTGQIVGQTLFTPFPSTYEEYAVFSDLTYHFTDQFDLQVGGRISKINQTFNESYFGVYDLCCTPTSPYTQPPEAAKSTPFTYLLTPRYKVSQDFMVYARVASGYRAGGTNSAGLGVPPSYQPDKTKDYEIGAKGDVLDHRVSFDASVYYIDWKNIQLGLSNPKTEIGYTGNAGGAKSEGVELSVQLRPVTGLNLAAWVVYNEAVLTEPLPPGPPGGSSYGVPGDALPYSSRWSGNLALDQDFPLTSVLTGFAGATMSYVGAREDGFTDSPARQYLPPYARTDLRAGLKYDLWTANLYANNVADRRGVISGGLGEGLPTHFFEIQPRTIGISVTRTF
jgi:iron complex outermembrane recepter protein